jgi:hypothetical protein
MTNQNAQIKRAVKLALRREKRKSDLQEKFFPRMVTNSKRKSELPDYITDNPFYP